MEAHDARFLARADGLRWLDLGADECAASLSRSAATRSMFRKALSPLSPQSTLRLVLRRHVGDRPPAAGITVSLRPTGLFSDPGRVMTPEFADYAWKTDQRIAELTGQTFAEAYRRQVLNAEAHYADITSDDRDHRVMSGTPPAGESFCAN